MRRVRYASTNDIRYTACECVPFRVAIERIVNR